MVMYNLNDVNPYILSCGHLDRAFLINYTSERNLAFSGGDFGKRQVKWYELELILWGEGYIITEGEKLSARKGTLFFRKPGMVVQGFSPYYCYSIAFDMVFDISNKENYNRFYSNNSNLDPDIEIQDENFSGFNFPYSMITNQYEKFQELFSNIHHEYIYGRKDNQIFLKSSLLQILILAYEELSSVSLLNSSSRSIRLNHSKIMETKKFIDSNIHMKFKLDNLADMVNLSPSYFCRTFKTILGEAPINYINKNKIRLVKKMLLETNKAIKEISYTCGFENDTYFFTLFKKSTGMSPSKFRDINRRMLIP